MEKEKGIILRSITDTTTLESNLATGNVKLKMSTPSHSAIPFLGLYSRETGHMCPWRYVQGHSLKHYL